MSHVESAETRRGRDGLHWITVEDVFGGVGQLPGLSGQLAEVCEVGLEIVYPLIYRQQIFLGLCWRSHPNGEG